jgi:hypothetical protein
LYLSLISSGYGVHPDDVVEHGEVHGASDVESPAGSVRSVGQNHSLDGLTNASDSDSKDGDYIERSESRRRGRDLKGSSSRRTSGRMVKQRVDIGALEDNINAILAAAKKESEVEDLECVEELAEVPKDKKRPPAGISPKSCRRSRYEFPSSLRALKADRPCFVKMSIPERLAPKSFTHTVAQEYAWACTFVGDMRTVQDGSVSGSWAPFGRGNGGVKLSHDEGGKP